LSPSRNGIAYAPAEKPFQEAVESVETELNRAPQDRLAKFKLHHDKLRSYDRQIGSIVLCETRTVEEDNGEPEHIDIAVIKVNNKCPADNRLSKLAVFASIEFLDGGDKINWSSREHRV